MVDGYATISRPGFTDVVIYTNKVEHDTTNMVSENPIPNKGQADTKTILVDIARVKEAVTVSGYLLDETASSAQAKKVILLDMIRNSATKRGAISVTWGTSPFSEAAGNKLTGNISKFKITETSDRIGNEGGTDTRGFAINIQIIRGETRG